jgi:hypothetical protein
LATANAQPRRRTARKQRTSRRRDEDYVVELCDQILGTQAQRQHHFEWLLGDPGKDGRRVALPVDAYYAEHGLIVEYREKQHYEAVPHFDKPHVTTVSGVPRGEQRRLYDRRREEEIPRHGLRLVVVRYDQLSCKGKRLARDEAIDRDTLRNLLASESGRRRRE